MQLSLRLKQATHDLHQAAERSGLMPLLLRSQLSHAQYAALLRNLQPLYAALEQGLAQAVQIPEIDFVPLYRSQALAQDLVFWAAPAETPLCAATQAYVLRLQALGAERSHLLLAHAYVRYLGDLHGGQMLRRCVARLLPIDAAAGEAAAGLQFYDFGAPERVAQLIQAFRSGLDRVPLDAAQAEAMAQEARLGFALHVDMFRQLPHAPAA